LVEESHEIILEHLDDLVYFLEGKSSNFGLVIDEALENVADYDMLETGLNFWVVLDGVEDGYHDLETDALAVYI
jgi:hypothetical protein